MTSVWNPDTRTRCRDAGFTGATVALALTCRTIGVSTGSGQYNWYSPVIVNRPEVGAVADELGTASVTSASSIATMQTTGPPVRLRTATQETYPFQQRWPTRSFLADAFHLWGKPGGPVRVYEPAMIVASISQFDEFGVRTRRLGACHSGYGVTHEHYETAGPVLLDGLDDTLGSA